MLKGKELLENIKRDSYRKKDSSLQTVRDTGDEGQLVREGDVTVNQHFPFVPPGPHVAHQHSRTWKETV